jgi:RecA-family ATPase
LTLKEMADLPPPEWLIDGLVPQDGLVVLYGEPRAGKSFLALDWGLSVATGVPWLGHEVRSGEVVYIYAEGTRGLMRRARAWVQEHGNPEASTFRAVPSAVAIPDPRDRREFVDAVRSVSKRPRLIIIDTLAPNFGSGNESLAQDMNAFVHGCDDLRTAFAGATVIAVHHSGKDQKKGARGSLALKGAADAEFALIRSGDTLTLKTEKQKDGEEAKPMPLELAQLRLADGNTSLVIRSTKNGASGAVASVPHKDPRTVKTDAGTLKALASFGPGGAALADWERAAGRANDTLQEP